MLKTQIDYRVLMHSKLVDLTFLKKKKRDILIFCVGVVSLNQNELKTLCDFSKKTKTEIEVYIKSEIPEFEKMKGKEIRSLSKEELLNRDYYQGRFASKNKNQEIVYNWEDKEI